MRQRGNELDQERLLRSLTEVGPSKSVGYLPLDAFELARIPLDATIAVLTAIGLATAQFGAAGCCIRSGALYAYHREALAALLQANADALQAAGLPLDPDEFVARIASVWFDENHQALPVIAKAFGGGL